MAGGLTDPSCPGEEEERERERESAVAILAQAVSGSSPEPGESEGGEQPGRVPRGEKVHQP